MNERRRVLFQPLPCLLSNSDYRHVSASKRRGIAIDKAGAAAWSFAAPSSYLSQKRARDAGDRADDAFLQQLRRIDIRRIAAGCYNITKVGRCVGNGPGTVRTAPGATAMRLVPIKVEMGFVSGAVCARAPARPDVRACASSTASAQIHSTDKFTVASADASSDARNAPADPAGRDDRADDRCPICTLIHLAGALVLAEPPSLPLPDVSGRLPIETAVAFDFSEPQRALFAARAPPTA